MSGRENVAITLKWGTLKGWHLEGESPHCMELLQRYADLGSSMSAAMQHDTPEQKQLICDLIDEVKGGIYLDWDGKHVTKDEAKKYVREYGQKEPTALASSPKPVGS